MVFSPQSDREKWWKTLRRPKCPPSSSVAVSETESRVSTLQTQTYRRQHQTVHGVPPSTIYSSDRPLITLDCVEAIQDTLAGCLNMTKKLMKKNSCKLWKASKQKQDASNLFDFLRAYLSDPDLTAEFGTTVDQQNTGALMMDVEVQQAQAVAKEQLLNIDKILRRSVWDPLSYTLVYKTEINYGELRDFLESSRTQAITACKTLGAQLIAAQERLRESLEAAKAEVSVSEMQRSTEADA